ncbi:MAG TPA: hypothetical protein VK536_01755 [Candidatus Limnocylindrales bacterium]|nr:hypothetical protein [Candidatus Limnocylindrales bacterium]
MGLLYLLKKYLILNEFSISEIGNQPLQPIVDKAVRELKVSVFHLNFCYWKNKLSLKMPRKTVRAERFLPPA